MTYNIKYCFITLLIVLCIYRIYSEYRRYILRYLLKHVATELNKTNIKYWIDFGTLLGIYREHDIILYDNDVDICVEYDDNLAIHMEKIKHMLQPKNIKIKRQSWDAYRAFYGILPETIHCDIYINYRNNKDNIYKGATGKTSNIPIDLIGNPTKKLSYQNVPLNTPENIVDTLIWRYGEDFMTPKIFYKGRNP